MRRDWLRTTMALLLTATFTACVPDDLESDIDDEIDEAQADLDDELDQLDAELGDARDELREALDDLTYSGRPGDRAAVVRLGEHLGALHDAGITGVLAQLELGRHRVLARRGVARIDRRGPVPWDARFRMGSVTKTFVAVVVLQLVGEGRISLEDTVERWLPGVVQGNGNDGSRITVRQLLQHTSGLFNYTSDLFGEWTPENYRRLRFTHVEPETLIASALRHPPNFAPGTAWSYSNTNYVLAGMIIERVTGRRWPDEVKRRIVSPLGLCDTYEPGDDPDLRGPHAHGYEEFVEGGPLVDVTLQNHSWADAAGSLITTTDDVTRFLQALRSGRLLRPAELAEMQRTVPATELDPVMPGLEYGLGLMRFPTSCGGAFWSHFGDTNGFSTRTAIRDDGARTVVVSLTTVPAGPKMLDVITESLHLLDDAMCVGR